MHHIDLILTLTTGLSAALVLGYITQRIGLSPIVGYLLAGVVIGPTTPWFFANNDLAAQLAEMGVILLMFGVGLHFHLKELLAVRRVAVPGAVGQSLVATALGAALVIAFGWTWQAGVVFGLAISVASTVVLLRVLADNNDLHTAAGHIAVGWLIVEDLFTVLVLVLMPVLFAGDGTELSTIGTSLGLAVLKLSAMVGLVFIIGGRVIPWFLTLVAGTRSRELFTLAVLVLALGIAVGSAQLFGVSMALGAFLAGMVVGRSEFSSRAASEALPMRDAFAVIFFVSVGMLFEPQQLLESPLLVLGALAVILIGKPLSALLIVLLLRYPVKVALSVAIALGQIGEFSFILAGLGRELKVLPESATNALVAAAIVSISLNPLVYRVIPTLERSLGKWNWLSSWIASRTRQMPQPDHRADETPRAIVVGYGPVGRTLVRMLQENGIEPTIIELNLDTVHRLQAEGLRAVYGDVSHQQTLLDAGLENAVAIILSASNVEASEEVIRVVRDVNPRIAVLARSTYLREAPSLRHAGADIVFSGEGEVALTMTEHLLRQLGATEEQIDRERQRVREELFGTPLTVEILLPLPVAKPKPAAEPARREV